MATRYANAAAAFGAPAFDRISTAKVLVVGAGGIGAYQLLADCLAVRERRPERVWRAEFPQAASF